MNKNKKYGVTMISLVVYVILFSFITVLAATIYTNMNETLFTNRGRAINYTELNKLSYNITESALTSSDISLEGNTIKYSNGDVYKYDETNKTLLLNGGLLCSNVTDFSSSISQNGTVKKLEITIEFSKYLNKLNKVLVSSLEVE